MVVGLAQTHLRNTVVATRQWFGLIPSDVGCDSCILTKVVFSSPKSLNFGIIAHFIVI